VPYPGSAPEAVQDLLPARVRDVCLDHGEGPRRTDLRDMRSFVRNLMPRGKRTPTPIEIYRQIVPIHNHMKGIFRCLECGGPCFLGGAEGVLTGLVRELVECEQRGQGRIPFGVERRLRECGVDLDKMRATR
jgi:hypothetical protein